MLLVVASRASYSGSSPWTIMKVISRKLGTYFITSKNAFIGVVAIQLAYSDESVNEIPVLHLEKRKGAIHCNDFYFPLWDDARCW